MYEHTEKPILRPAIEVRLRCLEAAALAYRNSAGTKARLSIEVDVLMLAEAYEKWVREAKD
jgi:hypothetical protein